MHNVMPLCASFCPSASVLLLEKFIKNNYFDIKHCKTTIKLRYITKEKLKCGKYGDFTSIVTYHRMFVASVCYICRCQRLHGGVPVILSPCTAHLCLGSLWNCLIYKTGQSVFYEFQILPDLKSLTSLILHVRSGSDLCRFGLLVFSPTLIRQDAIVHVTVSILDWTFGIDKVLYSTFSRCVNCRRCNLAAIWEVTTSNHVLAFSKAN